MDNKAQMQTAVPTKMTGQEIYGLFRTASDSWSNHTQNKHLSHMDNMQAAGAFQYGPSVMTSDSAAYLTCMSHPSAVQQCTRVQ